MDRLSIELHLFLIGMGRDPRCVTHRMEHYIEHLLRLLPSEHEKTLQAFYGICGQKRKTLRKIAEERNISEEKQAADIACDLRKLAVTPEWQMLKQLVGEK